ncbi:hypothetical protein EB796_017364 [Bugula neritina]|uniref:Uncharacterized protein n=1 Tax=Bugula neritina TaxID=10212 RepID=A0A7J7JE72_BUGNE|nr:hypothetical protein EB796_017364 [Bugula neritina]
MSFKNRNLIARTEFGSSSIFLHTLPEMLTDSSIATIPLLFTFKLFEESQLMPVTSLVGDSLLVGSDTLANTCWCDVSTQQTIGSVSHTKESKLADLTSAIICSGENLLVVCGARTGSLYTLDTRQSQSSMLAAPSTDQSKFWSACGKGTNELLLANDNNQLYIYDIRYPLKERVQTTLTSSLWTRRKSLNNFTCQSFSDWLSVSGKDNKIRIYNISKIEGNIEATPCFTHDGHLPDVEGGDMPDITTHCWKNCGTPSILSTSNTGQLHTWMFTSAN